MQQAAVHPWIIGSVALVGAGAIAVSPVAPNLPDLQLPSLSAVQLTAEEQLNFDGWTSLFSKTETNVTGLFDHAADLRDGAEADFDTLCDVLDGACARWGAHDVPCFAFLALPDDAFPG